MARSIGTTPTCSTPRASWASGRTAIAAARNVAQGLADHLNEVLNRTVTDARLSLVASTDQPDEFTLTCLVDHHPAPFALHSAKVLLFVDHRVRVEQDGHCRTLSYSYRLQRDAGRKSWILRWEFLRQPPQPSYDYPLGHLHVNAELAGDAAPVAIKPFGKLHIATGRVAFEHVLWHLLSEWGVETRTDDWKGTLRKSLAGFEERRRPD